MQVNLNKIRGLMAEHGDTQKDRAMKLGVSKQLINLKLVGKSPISVKMLGDIAHLYGVAAAALINEAVNG